MGTSQIQNKNKCILPLLQVMGRQAVSGAASFLPDPSLAVNWPPPKIVMEETAEAPTDVP